MAFTESRCFSWTESRCTTGSADSGRCSGEEGIGSLYLLLSQSSPPFPPPPRNHLRAFLRLHPREEAVPFVTLALVTFGEHINEAMEQLNNRSIADLLYE